MRFSSFFCSLAACILPIYFVAPPFCWFIYHKKKLVLFRNLETIVEVDCKEKILYTPFGL